MKRKVIACVEVLGMTEAIKVQLALQNFIAACNRPYNESLALELKDALQAGGAILHDTSIVNAQREKPR